MKPIKKLLLSGGILLIAIALVIPASWAWFTATQRATASGLTLTAVVPNNLQISSDGSTWRETLDLGSDVKKMLPVSSVNGVDGTFYKQAIDGAGGIFDSSDEQIAVENIEASTADDETYYYIDIPFYLRVIDDSDGESICVSSVRISSINSESFGLADAYRVALFSDADTDDADALLFFGANDLSNRAVYPVKNANTLAEKSQQLSRSINVSEGAQKYTIRIWLEGQDQNCVNANAQDQVTVSIEFGSADAAS